MSLVSFPVVVHKVQHVSCTFTDHFSQETRSWGAHSACPGQHVCWQNNICSHLAWPIKVLWTSHPKPWQLILSCFKDKTWGFTSGTRTVEWLVQTSSGSWGQISTCPSLQLSDQVKTVCSGCHCPEGWLGNSWYWLAGCCPTCQASRTCFWFFLQGKKSSNSGVRHYLLCLLQAQLCPRRKLYQVSQATGKFHMICH